jgi:hypothetical protein
MGHKKYWGREAEAGLMRAAMPLPSAGRGGGVVTDTSSARVSNKAKATGFQRATPFGGVWGSAPQIFVDWALGLFPPLLVDWALGLFPQFKKQALA